MGAGHGVTLLTCPTCGNPLPQGSSPCPRCGAGPGSSAPSPAVAGLFPQPVVKLHRVTAPNGALVRLSAAVFFGRGIYIEAVPERIPGSLFVSGGFRKSSGGPDPPVHGTYNRNGTLLPIRSAGDAARARQELGGFPFPAPHVTYCKIPGTPVVANLPRGNDLDGRRILSGYAMLTRSRSEPEILGSVSTLYRALGEAGLFGPLTPLERIPQRGRDDPRAYDYFANDPAVWRT